VPERLSLRNLWSLAREQPAPASAQIWTLLTPRLARHHGANSSPSLKNHHLFLGKVQIRWSMIDCHCDYDCDQVWHVCSSMGSRRLEARDPSTLRRTESTILAHTIQCLHLTSLISVSVYPPPRTSARVRLCRRKPTTKRYPIPSSLGPATGLLTYPSSRLAGQQGCRPPP
jgi:hypothetical protein